LKATEEIFHQKTDYKKIVLNFFKYKYYFIFTVVVACTIAYAINKYSQPLYTNYSSILIAEEEKNAFMNSSDIVGGGFGLFSGIKNVENELAILTSYNIINDAVEELNLEITYGIEKNLFPVDFINYTSDEELYQNSPIQVILDQTHLQPIYVKIYVDIINDSTFKLSIEGYDISLYDYISESIHGSIDTLKVSGVFKFGEKIKTDQLSFSVHLNKSFFYRLNKGQRYFFTMNSISGLTRSYQARLSVSTTSSTSSIIIVSLHGKHPQKLTDFLNNLTEVYQEKNLEKKNNKAFNTVKFIDARISDIADSLTFAENRLQHFRSANQVMDMSFQGQKLFERMSVLENERVSITIQQQYYAYIKEYFKKNDDVSDLLAPSSMEIQDPLLSGLINELLSVNSERMNYLQKSNSKNLFLKDLEIQISNLKNTILENIDYNSNRSVILLQEIDSRIAKMNGQISTLPKTERELIGMERQFKLNDAIYTFLLQKRAEAQIARASNAPDYEIIDKALFFRTRLISPKSSMNYLIALFLGLLIPFSLILIKDFFNDKVTDIKEIENMTSLSIIGHVHHNKTKSTAIIRDYPKSPLADSFRSIRTNLQFFSDGVDKMTILITSSMSGEGKSFCSINIASVYALLGKKTVLVGFDLRRPALFADFKLNNERGITSFLIRNARLNEIIQKTQIENLDLISAGPIPPNPVELIASKRTDELFDELRKMYDYIIIDSAPIGAVTDSFLLFKYADVNVFAIRHNFTLKDNLQNNLKSIVDKKVNNVSLLINDITVKKNSYGYSYQSKYYLNEKRMSGIKKVFVKKQA